MIETVECASGLVVKVRGLKVREFKLLADRGAMESGSVFETFLSSCLVEVVEPGPAYPNWSPGTAFSWKKALQGDRFAALLGIRLATHPENFEFDTTCSRCQKTFGVEVDLRSLPRIPYPESSIQSFVDGKPITLEIGGRRVSYVLFTGAEEERVQNHLKKLERSDKRTRRDAPFDPFVDGILTRVKVDGDLKGLELREWFEDLEAADVVRLQASIESTAGGIDTTIIAKHQTIACGATTMIELPFMSPRFWSPRTEQQAV